MTEYRTVTRRIIALSIPAIITNITTPLLALTDVAIVGHMGSAVFIAAIAVGGVMFNMLYWLTGFLRMGSSGLTAQAYGAGNVDECHLTLQRSLLLALLIGVAFVALQSPLADLLLTVLDADGATGELARSYFNICIWGAPAVVGSYALTGWLLGMQDTRTPMMVSIVIDLVNIGASLTLVYAVGMGLDGVATGTLIAQWVGFTVALAVIIRRHGFVPHRLSQIVRHGCMRRFFRINTDIFLRTVCLVAVTLWFTRVGAMQGAVMLAVNALLMQLFTLFSYVMDGFAFAGEALCGRFKGAGDTDMLQRVIRRLMQIGAVTATVFASLYFFCGEWILGLLSSEHEVVNAAAEYMPWAVTVPLAGFMAFVWDGIMIGTTDTRFMLLSMITATLVYFALNFLLYPLMGNHGLWLAFVTYLAIRGLMQIILYRRRGG